MARIPENKRVRSIVLPLPSVLRDASGDGPPSPPSLQRVPDAFDSDLRGHDCGPSKRVRLPFAPTPNKENLQLEARPRAGDPADSPFDLKLGQSSQNQPAAAAGAGAGSAPVEELVSGIPPAQRSQPPELISEAVLGGEWWDALPPVSTKLPRGLAEALEQAPPELPSPGTPRALSVSTRKRRQRAEEFEGEEEVDGEGEDADGAVAEALAASSPRSSPTSRKRRQLLSEDVLDMLSPAQARALLTAAAQREEELESRLDRAAKESHLLKRAVAIQAAQNKDLQSRLEQASADARAAQDKVAQLKKVNYELVLHLRSADNSKLDNSGRFGDVF